MNSREAEPYRSYTEVFALEVWHSILCLMAVSALLFWVVAYRKLMAHHHVISDCTIFVLGMFCQIGKASLRFINGMIFLAGSLYCHVICEIST